LALDAAEVQVPLFDERAHDVVGADLAFEQLGGQPVAVVVDTSGVLLKPLAPRTHPRVIDLRRASHKLPLIDLFDIHAELREPAIAV